MKLANLIMQLATVRLILAKEASQVVRCAIAPGRHLVAVLVDDFISGLTDEFDPTIQVRPENVQAHSINELGIEFVFPYHDLLIVALNEVAASIHDDFEILASKHVVAFRELAREKFSPVCHWQESNEWDHTLMTRVSIMEPLFHFLVILLLASFMLGFELSNLNVFQFVVGFHRAELILVLANVAADRSSQLTLEPRRQELHMNWEIL